MIRCCPADLTKARIKRWRLNAQYHNDWDPVMMEVWLDLKTLIPTMMKLTVVGVWNKSLNIVNYMINLSIITI